MSASVPPTDKQSGSTYETTEIEEIFIKSVDRLSAAERRARDSSDPPGFNFQRQWDEKTLKVSFCDKLLSRETKSDAGMDEIIETRKRLFKRVKTKHLHLEMINFAIFPMSKVEEILGDCEFDGLTVTIRGGEADPGLLDFIRRHETKEITVALEDSLPAVSSLLSLPRLSLTANWLSGFRGIWEDENALSERDFVELVKKKHTWLHLPVKFEQNGHALLEIVKEVSLSDVEQRVSLRVLPLVGDKFLKYIGIRQTEKGFAKAKPSSEFVVEGSILRYGEARIGMMKQYTRKYCGPGSMTFYMITIFRSFE